MDVELYKRAIHTNVKTTELYQRLGLPIKSFYTLFDAVRRGNAKLRENENYLVLLVSLWSPIRHLFPSFAGPFYSFLTSEEWQVGTKILFPQLYERITNSALFVARLYCHSSESSLNFFFRLSGYQKLLLNQRSLGADFEKWRKMYENHRPHMRQETKQLTAFDEYDPIAEEVRMDLLHVFEEYVQNLMIDPKNRTKYKPVLSRVRSYIRAVEKENDEDTDCDTADDIAGTVFERLLIYATQYEPLSLIGPVYICWIFEKRIFKIGNPENCNINVFLDTTKKEELFPLNCTVHSIPTVADEAQIYLFDELCELWAKHNLGETKLSKYIFERITPYYYDFMKADLGHPRITHKYVTYPVKTFTNEFLQRALGDIFRNLYVNHQSQLCEAQITAKDWKNYFYKDKKEELPFLEKIFARYNAIINEYSFCGKKAFDFIRLLHAIYRAATQKEFLKKFETLYYFPNQELDYNASPDEWSQRCDRLLMDFICNLNFTWEDDNITDLLQKCEDLRYAISYAVVLVCSKAILRSYEKELLVFSKKLFSEIILMSNIASSLNSVVIHWLSLTCVQFASCPNAQIDVEIAYTQ